MHALNIRNARTLLWAVVLVCGCSAPTPDPLPLTVGVHQVQLIVPEGWQHLDHGREQRFERELTQISLADLGPATPDGFRREILRARELYRQGQLEDARARLEPLRIRTAFPSEPRWESFSDPWSRIRWAGHGPTPLPRKLVEAAYTEVLAQIDALPAPSMETLALSVLETLGHDERYDIALQRAMTVEGRFALLVDTWDRLNHTHRRRHVIVLNEGNSLVTRMEMGRFPEMEPAFDELVASLGFRDEG